MRRPVGRVQTEIRRSAATVMVRPPSRPVPLRILAALAVLCPLLAWALAHGLAAGRGPVLPSAGTGVFHETPSEIISAARSEISATNGERSPAYSVAASGGGFQAVNGAQRLHARFGDSGVTVSSGSIRVGLRLRAVGYGSSLRSLPGVTPSAAANRVTYARPGLSEWYVNGPLGLEQGFTVQHAPSGHPAGALTLSIALSGDAHASLAGSGQSLTLGRAGGPSLNYGGLLAIDAGGRALRSWIELGPGSILLRVDSSGARYPVRIDPLIAPGEKLMPGDATFSGQVGSSVALSADGNTALISAPGRIGSAGGAWVFVRTESGWEPQGEKLVGREEVGGGTPEPCVEEVGEAPGECRFARSVAISADGDTALVGSPRDNNNAGAVWVFTRSGSTWSQQGPKLTGAGERARGHFGKSVALSADGNTALVGGSADEGGHGSAWVFTRSGTEWSEQGLKLTGAREEGEGHFGVSVALSADGNTALIGGPSDNGFVGAAWVFARSGSEWTQQGQKLTGPAGAGNNGRFGSSVALSADGNTALIGGRTDGKGVGAAWVFTRSGTEWLPQGPKLTGGGEVGDGEFGFSVALSGDGKSALIGGPRDNKNLGAAWEFTRTGTTWKQQGEKLTGAGETGKGWFGASVALPETDIAALIGAPHDSLNVGAAWMFNGTPEPPPRVKRIKPTSGPTSGGTAVTITGSGFLPGASVRIGSSATSVNIISETEIAAVTAETPAGHDEVVVANENGGVSTGGPSYAYVEPPPPPPPPPVKPPSKTVTNTQEPTVGLVTQTIVMPGLGVLSSKTVTVPRPVLAVSGNLAPISGTVLVKLPGSKTWVLLTSLRQVPFGTIINAIHGKVSVTTVGPHGVLQTATFYQGEFKLTQGRNAVVVATLFGGNFSVCPTARERSHLARASSRHASGKHSVRKLWAEGHGTYSTKGNYAAGAVLGTRWLTEDLCDGTLIHVATDRVLVTNLVNHHHITIKAGHSYLVKAP